ncbi:MAG TPA: S41 family peptidase [Pseudogracilibacillus sp.]|nr:S41 family peptidase [Pseudogracilibacillus sp.]
MNFRGKNIFILLIVVLAVGFFGAALGIKVFQSDDANTVNSSISDADSSEGDSDRVERVQDIIKENYIEDVDDEELTEGAIKGMLETLDDPYSSYMSGEEMEDFNEEISSSFQGIGAEVSMQDDKVTVIAPIKDSPAEKAGIRPNDQILKVDDEELEGMDLNEAVSHIRGEKGSEVELLVERKGVSDPFTVTLTRDDIPVETVETDIEEVDGKKTGILEINSFAETTAEETEDAVDELEDKDIEGLVLDVRGNPGGLLDSVEDIMDLFVPDDLPYVQIEDRDGDKDKFYSDLEEKKEYPINILIDEGSASASEILAVALKENGYDTVGETSFGKGTVQQTVPIDQEEGDTLKLTNFKWLSPEGNWIHEKGVEPTEEQEQPDYYTVNPLQIEDTLKEDQTDEQIKTAQIMLTGLDFETDRKDGYFDESTADAVKDFQKEDDLEVTGEIDEETAGKLETEIIEAIRDGDDDKQLEKALEVLY